MAEAHDRTQERYEPNWSEAVPPAPPPLHRQRRAFRIAVRVALGAAVIASAVGLARVSGLPVVFAALAGFLLGRAFAARSHRHAWHRRAHAARCGRAHAGYV